MGATTVLPHPQPRLSSHLPAWPKCPRGVTTASCLRVACFSGPFSHSMWGTRSQTPGPRSPPGHPPPAQWCVCPNTGGSGWSSTALTSPRLAICFTTAPCRDGAEVLVLQGATAPPTTVPQCCRKSRQDAPACLPPKNGASGPQRGRWAQSIPPGTCQRGFWPVRAKAPAPWEGALAFPPSRSKCYPHWHTSEVLGVTVLPSPGSVRAVPAGWLRPKVIGQLCRHDRLCIHKNSLLSPQGLTPPGPQRCTADSSRHMPSFPLFQHHVRGLSLRGADEDGFYGFLLPNIQQELKRAARKVRPGGTCPHRGPHALCLMLHRPASPQECSGSRLQVTHQILVYPKRPIFEETGDFEMRELVWKSMGFFCFMIDKLFLSYILARRTIRIRVWKMRTFSK